MLTWVGACGVRHGPWAAASPCIITSAVSKVRMEEKPRVEKQKVSEVDASEDGEGKVPSPRKVNYWRRYMKFKVCLRKNFKLNF
jgi:hypothetical protein